MKIKTFWIDSPSHFDDLDNEVNEFLDEVDEIDVVFQTVADSDGFTSIATVTYEDDKQDDASPIHGFGKAVKENEADSSTN